VGRYCPFSIVAELPASTQPLLFSVTAAGWFDRIELIARRALENDLLDLDALLAELHSSEQWLAGARNVGEPLHLRPAEFPAASALWRFDLNVDADMGRFNASLAAALMGQGIAPLALWWTSGSEHVAPSALLTRGLPSAATFQSFLQARWDSAWRGAAPFVTPPLPPQLHCISNALTDVGRHRSENQDAYLERADEGLWLVADGMGGHQAGGLASLWVTQQVASATLAGDLAMMAESVEQSLHATNAQLRQRGASEAGFDAGSTVVALCIRDGEAIVSWAGDSRLYRLRDGQLQQMTRDHSVANEPEAQADDDEHMLTRAVGGAAVLELDQRRFDVRAGDRFLLCSDGLYFALTDEEIAHRMALTQCAAATRALVNLALERGGEDNMTAVVVEVAANKIE
jgi:serine/threonine protein phosphatase PrpC